MMRIAYLINSMEGGGAASPIPALVETMQSRGCAVKVMALTRRNGLGIGPVAREGIALSVREGGETDHYAALRWAMAHVREWQATHIWTSLTRATLLGQEIGRRERLPVISWQHNAWLKPGNAILLRLQRKRTALWVADSTSVALATEHRLHLPPGAVRRWPIFRADPAAPSAQPWSAGQILRLGSLGRLHRAKGYDVLLEALAILRQNGFRPGFEWSVTIGGDGGDRHALEAAARNAGINNLSFAGFQADPQNFLAGLHGYLQPSRREGFCIAAHEAMQVALPVIGARIGEMPLSITGSGGGMITKPGDAEDLARKLHVWLTRPQDLARQGELARQWVQQVYSAQSFKDAGEAIIDQIACPAFRN